MFGLSQNFVVPLHPMRSHKNGWWLVIECSLMQIIAEQRIENGLLSVTIKILNLPTCFYTKEIQRFLAKLRKNERNAKGKLVFLFKLTYTDIGRHI